MKRSRDLQSILNRIDHKGYKAYKDILGSYDIGWFILHIDHVQSDPFAPPSRIRVEIDQTKAGFPTNLFSNKSRRIGLQDYIARTFKKTSHSLVKRMGTGSSGIISIDAGNQEIIERTSIKISKQRVEARINIGLPAAGRKILGSQAQNIFFKILPEILKNSLIFKNLPLKEVEHFVYLNEDQDILRNKLEQLGLVCFVANGSVLPRESGISDRPLLDNINKFKSPNSLEIEIELPYSGKIKGMGIPKGVTLIVGGGYHGKSTLLKAIERGVYNHIPNDGREFVVTLEHAVKIRAEDGRFICGTDISPFISNLPGNIDTKNFITENASGSTSQAANIMEALEAGTRLILMDEDTCATNFMIRDGRMQKLVSKECEPITPFVDRVKELYKRFGVSTILVLGGSGDYLDVADLVIMLKEYNVIDVTEKAQHITNQIKNIREIESSIPMGRIKQRYIGPDSIKLRDRDKVRAKGLHTILIGRSSIDLNFVEQLVDPSQTNAIAFFIQYISKKLKNRLELKKIIESIFKEIGEKGLETISPYVGKHPGSIAMPRRYEVMAAINRFRGLRTY